LNGGRRSTATAASASRGRGGAPAAGAPAPRAAPAADAVLFIHTANLPLRSVPAGAAVDPTKYAPSNVRVCFFPALVGNVTCSPFLNVFVPPALSIVTDERLVTL
jgi:hypothetical protein